jgi:hypothetical protein
MRFVLLLLPLIALAAAFQYVKHGISVGQPRVSWPQTSAAFAPIDPSQTLGSQFKIDDQDIQRSMAAGIDAQNRQFSQRMEDLRNYARNPAGWHGMPPH